MSRVWILGTIFTIMGVLLLLKSLGVLIAGSLWGIFWALVFIAIGVGIITRGTRWARWCCFDWRSWCQGEEKKEQGEKKGK